MARGINGAARSGNPILILSAACPDTYKKQIQSTVPRILIMEHLGSVKSIFPPISSGALEQKTSQHCVDGEFNSILASPLRFLQSLYPPDTARTVGSSGRSVLLS